MRKTFREAVCIKTHWYNEKLFTAGEIYPIVGNNNGSQLVYRNSDGDSIYRLLCDEIDGILFNPENSSRCFIEV